MARTPTVATLTGLVDLVAPDPDTITISAIAHHLAQLNRYAGALELPLSVAQHSVLTADIFRRLHPQLPAVYAVLHHAPEFVWGDMIRPVQERIELAFPGFRAWLRVEHGKTDAALRAKFGLPDPTPDIELAVHQANEIALATEWRCLMPAAAGACPVDAPPMRGMTIKPLHWMAAADAFKEALARELAIGGFEVAA